MITAKGILLSTMAATIYAGNHVTESGAVYSAIDIYKRVQKQMDAERAAVDAVNEKMRATADAAFEQRVKRMVASRPA